MNHTSLKIIAIITMLIDHIGAILIPESIPLNFIFRMIGRLSFPIFCFLLVEGFFHTKNVYKYIIRLSIFAVIAEVPFDLAFNGKIVFLASQNIFVTLLIGLITINAINIIEKKYEERKMIMFAMDFLMILSACAVAMMSGCDYGMSGVLLIAMFYLFRGQKINLIIAVIVVLYFGEGSVGIIAALSLLFILKYNGKKGREIKYFFYAFYPLHLLILYGISFLI